MINSSLLNTYTPVIEGSKGNGIDQAQGSMSSPGSSQKRRYQSRSKIQHAGNDIISSGNNLSSINMSNNLMTPLKHQNPSLKYDTINTPNLSHPVSQIMNLQNIN